MLGKRDTTQAQLVIGVPALRRDHPDAGPSRCSTRSSATGCPAACSCRCARSAGSPTTCRPGSSTTPTPGARGLGRASIPSELPAAIEAILAELARLRDEPVPAEELAKAKGYLAGGLELRMDETRHLASWIGGQEALHDRVLTLDEALAAVEAVDAPTSSGSPSELFRDDGAAAGGRRAGRATCAASSARPQAAGMSDCPPASGRRCDRSVDLILARLHLELGSLQLARAELETLAGRGTLDDEALAISRRRAGARATWPAPARRRRRRSPQGTRRLALVISAEATAAAGRPAEARRLAGRALELADLSSPTSSPGMPRASIWPIEPGRSPTVAEPLFGADRRRSGVAGGGR